MNGKGRIMAGKEDVCVGISNNGFNSTENKKRRGGRAFFIPVLTFFLIFYALWTGFLIVKANAMDVTLQWDTNEDADYYVIYYGTTTGNYTQNSQNITAPIIQHTLSGLSQTIWYFSVKAFSSCGNSSDFSDEIVHIPFYSPLSISIESPVISTHITQGESINFQGLVSGGAAPLSYSWDFGTGGPSGMSVEDPGNVIFDNPGMHTVTFTVTDANNEIQTSTVIVTVDQIVLDINPEAQISSPSAIVTITEGDSVQFEGLVSNGNAPYTYFWNFGFSMIPDGYVEDPGSVVFPLAGVYTVRFTVTDSDGDMTTASTTVTVVDRIIDFDPVASISSPDSDATIIQGGSVEFNGTVSSGNAPLTHTWDFGDSAIPPSSVEDPGRMVFNRAGTYTVTYTVTDDDGDASNATMVVTVLLPDTTPLASMTSPAANMSITQGGSVNFQATVAGGNAPYTHAWSFGESGLVAQTVEDPGTLNFNVAGTYTVVYTVTDNDGDTSSASRTVIVTPVNQNNEPDAILNPSVSTSNPGAKNSDGFIPPTEKSIAESEDDQPTIDVRDSQLKHLLWLKSGWSTYNKMNGESRIATGDINGDGKDEVIIGLSSENSTPTMPGGFFQILDNKYNHMAWGRIEWADYNETNGETWPACGDVDGDGKDEIIIGLGKNGGGYIEIFGWVNGQLVHKNWLQLQWPDYNDTNGEVRPVCADINGDGKDDIIAGLGSLGGDPNIPGGKFEAFSRINGQYVHLLWGFVDWPEYAEINGETWPATGDVDGDGDIELVVGLGQGGEGQMAVFEFSDGEAHQSDWVQIQWPEYNDVFGETRPICGDVDNDGKDEVILGWSTSTEGDDNSHYFKVLSFNTTSKTWVNFRDSKAATVVDIDSMPMKGSVDQDSRIYIGMGSDEEKSITSQVNKVAGAGGSSGCFINSSSE